MKTWTSKGLNEVKTEVRLNILELMCKSSN